MYKRQATAALGEPRAADASFAYRVWGGLLWDLAQDPTGAENALYQASLFVADGPERYARDLKTFTGSMGAIEGLLARVGQLGEDPANDRRRGALLIEAAGVARRPGDGARSRWRRRRAS